MVVEPSFASDIRLWGSLFINSSSHSQSDVYMREGIKASCITFLWVSVALYSCILPPPCSLIFWVEHSNTSHWNTYYLDANHVVSPFVFSFTLDLLLKLENLISNSALLRRGYTGPDHSNSFFRSWLKYAKLPIPIFQIFAISSHNNNQSF